MVNITYEEFEKIMSHIERLEDIISNLYSKHNINLIESDFVVILNDLYDVLTKLLNDSDRHIEWWCFETDFGRKHDNCVIYDENNNAIMIDSIQKLWLLLTNEEELWK